jgi:hypothetical protein
VLNRRQFGKQEYFHELKTVIENGPSEFTANREYLDCLGPKRNSGRFTYIIFEFLLMIWIDLEK